MDAQLSHLTAVVVDDEPLPRLHLAQLLKEAGVGNVIQAGGAAECLELFEDEDERPDWAFLDVRMPGLDGLELADALGAGQFSDGGKHASPAIVFVTGYEDYAIQAFERGAADYLLKPVRTERLNLTLKRLVTERLAQTTFSSPPSDLPAPALQRLPIRLDYSVRLVDTEDIIGATARDKRVEVITRDASYTTYYTLNQLEQRLPGEWFVRVHDSWIINIKQIVEIHNLGSQTYQLSLRDTDRIAPVSRRRLHVLQKRLGL